MSPRELPTEMCREFVNGGVAPGEDRILWTRGVTAISGSNHAADALVGGGATGATGACMDGPLVESNRGVYPSALFIQNWTESRFGEVKDATTEQKKAISIFAHPM